MVTGQSYLLKSLVHVFKVHLVFYETTDIVGEYHTNNVNMVLEYSWVVMFNDRDCYNCCICAQNPKFPCQLHTQPMDFAWKRGWSIKIDIGRQYAIFNVNIIEQQYTNAIWASTGLQLFPWAVALWI